MKVKPISMLAMAAALSLGAAACSDNGTRDAAADTSSDTAMTGEESTDSTAMKAADAHAAQFVTEAMKGDNSEVKLGKLAISQGSTGKVKDFGRTLVEDHSNAKNEVAQLAMSMDVPVTDATMPEAEAEYAKLKEMTGSSFDREFASYMVDDHKKDIAKFKEEAASSDPAPVTELAKNTIPTLQKHLDIAQSL